jgi:hypothetical protein
MISKAERNYRWARDEWKRALQRLREAKAALSDEERLRLHREYMQAWKARRAADWHAS